MTGAVPPPPPSPRVAALRRTRGGRLRVELDDGRTLELAPSVLETLPLRTGDPVDQALEARLVEADLKARARDAALALLSVRARSRKELADRLRRKDFPGAVVEACVAGLEAEGWIDDQAFADGLVRDRLRLRPRGPGRMAQELRSKGVGDAVARRAVDRVFDEESVSVSELARDVARGWFRRQSPGIRAALLSGEFGPEREKARRRLHAFLARRGFTGAVARAALEALEEDDRD